MFYNLIAMMRLFKKIYTKQRNTSTENTPPHKVPTSDYPSALKAGKAEKKSKSLIIFFNKLIYQV
jgi:hypothetical protein